MLTIVIGYKSQSMDYNRMFQLIWERKVPFFAVFFVVVLVTYTLLTVIDFIPEPKSDEIGSLEVTNEESSIAENGPESIEAVETVVIDPLPHKIIFDSLNREVTISNPESRDITDLDAALLSGAVRHPDSADFSEPGNIFILGHSSYLPNVFNKNFQAFNGIQELTWGDKIRLQSEDHEYTYFVEEVYKARAEEVVVPETPGKANLTLATCNSFGAKDDRFIVEAKLVSERAL